MSDLGKAVGLRRVLSIGLAIISMCGLAQAEPNSSSVEGIYGGDAMGIYGGDAMGIYGGDAELLVLGEVEYVGEGFISVLGQTVFGNRGSLGVGTTVAVYGSIDADTGGIVDAQVVAVGPRNSGANYLRGTVDEVNLETGLAVVSGVTVDYNAMLSSGSAPRVGDTVGMIGRSYSGLLVADPSLSLD